MRILTFQSGPKKGPINYALTLITGKKYTSKDADGIAYCCKKIQFSDRKIVIVSAEEIRCVFDDI